MLPLATLFPTLFSSASFVRVRLSLLFVPVDRNLVQNPVFCLHIPISQSRSFSFYRSLRYKTLFIGWHILSWSNLDLGLCLLRTAVVMDLMPLNYH